MDKYLIKTPRTQDSAPAQDSSSSSKRIRVDFNLENLPSNPGLREKISSYHPNHHDEIRRYYLTKSPCQPVLHSDDYPISYFSGKPRRLYPNAFRGHDESQGSNDKGNFLEHVQFLGDHNESINEVLQKALKNCKLTHPEIQKDIVNVIARETSKAIIKDLDNRSFSILVDVLCDISVKEQMTLVLHYVNKEEIIIEQFLGYDGASNMQGDINDLKTLILKENKSAFYVHCFTYQLQLTLVAVANNHINIVEFFYMVSNLVTVVKGSCKRRDALQDTQFAKIKENLENSVRRSGQGLNQETNLKRPGDTRWGSYYGTILNLILMLFAIGDVLEIIEEVIDMQLQELNNRFSEANIDLLLCMACLNPNILALDSQLQNYIFDMRNNDFFLKFQRVSELAEKLVSTRKHETYPLVYLLVKLALTLPVAIATVKRSFSVIKYIKNELRNRMGDQWMNDCLVVYIEKDVTCNIHNEIIMQRFQNMKTRRR
ncbi:uncharacterized protein LOC112022883 [Quercus suber]|uniref:uncharacterized protein LOC112022883 n=1 Tax=Quercus suber TaxID=58331 RepID=UPI0032DFD177